MRLTLMTDYALRLLMFVASKKEGELSSISEVANVFAISENHLMKITHLLGQAGWLATVRGRGGGIRLAMDADEINLADVVKAMEPDFNLVSCFESNSNCSISKSCRLAVIVDDALGEFLNHLEKFTLADVIPKNAFRTI